MILTRIRRAIRNRDWGAIAIEFVIVVLGILLALQAEDWNQARRDRHLEQIYIGRLIDDTTANLALLSEHEKIYENKIKFILDLPEMSLTDALQRDSMAFMFQLDYSTYVAIPDMRSETYQELESSGQLSLLRDTDLRSAIGNNLNHYRSTQPVLMESIGDYRRILFETLPGRSFYAYRIEDGEIDVSAVAEAIDAFRNDPRFPAAANAEVTYGSDTLFWIREFKKQTEDILVLLQGQT